MSIILQFKLPRTKKTRCRRINYAVACNCKLGCIRICRYIGSYKESTGFFFVKAATRDGECHLFSVCYPNTLIILFIWPSCVLGSQENATFSKFANVLCLWSDITPGLLCCWVILMFNWSLKEVWTVLTLFKHPLCFCIHLGTKNRVCLGVVLPSSEPDN